MLSENAKEIIKRERRPLTRSEMLRPTELERPSSASCSKHVDPKSGELTMMW